MNRLYEEGDAIYSEAHAKELLNIQANYNKMLQDLNNKLAKQKSECNVKYMKIAQQQTAAANAAAKAAVTSQTTNTTKQTGTVDTAGNATNASGNPAAATVESYPDILNIKELNEVDDEIRFSGGMAHMDNRNWYEKPVTGGHKEPEKREPRKKDMTWKIRSQIMDLEDEIKQYEDEIEDLKRNFESPEGSVEGEVEEFFAQIGPEASEVLNSGAYKDESEKLRALQKAGVADAESILQDYYYYYPEFNPALDKKRKEIKKEIPKIQVKIDKVQKKIDKLESMYEGLNERFKEKSDPIKDLRIGMHTIEMDTTLPVKKIGEKYIIDETSSWAETFLEDLEELDIKYKVIDPKGPGGGWPIVEYTGTIPNLIRMLKENFSVDDDDIEFYLYGEEYDEDFNESVNENSFLIKNVDPYELQDLKDYLDAENISYSEDEDGETFDFDETELDQEWRDRMDDMGFEDNNPDSETDDILSMDDDDEDFSDKSEKIDEEKVFYIQVDDEGESFIGKIYKLFDEGDWRSKLVDGESDTFEKLNYDPDWDEVDIIAFLRENYADAELMSEEEYNSHIEDPEAEPEEMEVEESAHSIPTFDQFLNEIKFSDGMEFDTSGELHTEHRNDGWYVVGKNMLIPVKSKDEGEEYIAKLGGTLPKPKSKKRRKLSYDDKQTRQRSFSGGWEKDSWRGPNPNNH